MIGIKEDNKKGDFYKNIDGITLVALVVTIIVLIILAGTTINLILGQNGILVKAQEAKRNYQEAVEKEKEELEKLQQLERGIKIIEISKAVKGKNKNELVGYEEYVGDFIKIGDETLKQLKLDWTGNYYVNIKTGEIYDCTEEAEQLNGITYRTIEEYYQIVKSKNINRTQRLLKIKNKQIEEINNLQYNSGAYATYSRSTTKTSKSVPYFNCIGLQGLMNDIPSLPNVKKYIQWHLAHINSEDIAGNVGTIYDYNIGVNGEEAIYNEEKLYDSIDSYASLFLILLEEYYNKTGDKSIFVENQEEIQKVENALNSMFDYEKNGTNLTLTKTQYKVYYLMDNCESYAGYQSLARIYKNIYNNNEKSNLYEERAELVKNEINNKLWNEDNSNEQFHFYDYALGSSSYTGLLFDRTYYPYVLGQLYPILYHIVDVDTEQSQHLYFLHQYYSDWSKDGNNLWYTFNHNDDKYPHFESLLATLMYQNTKFDTRLTNYKINVEYEIEQAIAKISNDYTNNTYEYYWTIAERGYIIRSLNMYMNK